MGKFKELKAVCDECICIRCQENMAMGEQSASCSGCSTCNGIIDNCPLDLFQEEYMEPMEFYVKYWPENPDKLMAEGINVPVMYLGLWWNTCGCNNWRKLHNMPMWRKKLQFKYAIKIY